MSLLLDRVKKGEVLVSDGAMGTMLHHKGLGLGECPEEWNITHPGEVKAIAEAYLKAGSDMILTNTFGGSRFKLAKFGLEANVAEFNKAGVALAKKAALQYGGIVAASLGPTGEFMRPLGTVTEGEMYDVFREQILAQIQGGADAICIETMTSLEEVSIAIKVVKENTAVPAIATMTFDKGMQGYKTMMGVSIKEAALGLEKAGADIIGTNCGNGIGPMIDIVLEMRRYSSKPILVHANAGVPELIHGKTCFKETPLDMAKKVSELINAGANIIGGCCGTTPEHIRAIRNAVDSRLF
ncbi:MAG: homocysteine S-methyltransferase family protein [bacterium]|nr:homocysteine S-methyltransferase family protein [bacterium]